MLQFTRSAQTACEAAPARAAEASEQLHTPDRHHVTDAETTQLHVQLLAELTARERRIEASTARPDSSTGYEHGHVTGSEKMDANLAAASSIRQEEAGAEASNKEKEQEDHEKIHPQQDERIREPPESWWGWQRLWLFGSGGQAGLECPRLICACQSRLGCASNTHDIIAGIEVSAQGLSWSDRRAATGPFLTWRACEHVQIMSILSAETLQDSNPSNRKTTICCSAQDLVCQILAVYAQRGCRTYDIRRITD